jgi:hypothetical protein
MFLQYLGPVLLILQPFILFGIMWFFIGRRSNVLPDFEQRRITALTVSSCLLVQVPAAYCLLARCSP